MNSINIRCLLSLITFCCLYLTCSGELDFQFNDELQVTLPQSPSQQQQHHHHDDDNSQPVATLKTQHHHKSTYSKEISQCPYTEDKIMLSLILKSNDWSNIIDNKKNRVINKLSKFFNIPKEYIKLDSISRPDMIEMAKWSIKSGPNKCNSNRHHGKIEFMIGCGQSSYFIIGNSILKQIGQQMKDGGIDDITGVDFGWWVIWRKQVTNRVSRKIRDVEGSGIEEEDYVYDDEDDEPMELTEIPTTPIHAHRHHHGINKTGDEDDSNTNETLKEDEILNETTTNRLEDTTVSAVQQSVLIETSTNAPITTTTPVPTTTTTTQLPSTEYIEPEPINTPPIIKNRLPKQPVTAGKLFSLVVPSETFYDNEDATNLRLELFDKNGHELKSNSWLQFNPETREIYGLPLEDAVSRYNYRLTATDSGNETITETLDISVQQHKGHRSVNHEISLGVKLNQKFLRNIDWQIRLVKGIADTLKDDSSSSIVVREVRQNQQDPYFATFIYTNESLPKDKCPDEKLDELLARLDREKLTESVMPELSIKSITGQPIGPCQKFNVVKTKPTPRMTKNSPPLPRNQVDRVNATVGHLLVYKVPPDTFYDDEDTTDLKLTLLTNDHTELGPRHWLQFDTKNQEFYGIPRAGDYGSEEYILVAEDREGLTASDALIVVVNHSSKREYNVYFKVFLGIRHELFNSHMQRKFVERIAKLFNDPSPQYIQIRSITTNHDADGTIVNFFNTTLHRYHRNRCPEEEIEMVRNIWFSQDTILRDRVKKTIGSEFDITNVQMMPLASCYNMNGDIHRDIIPYKTDDNNTSSTFKDDYMLTFVLPAIIILAMILLALIIACVLHRRRLTGKMELGDEEERKSFRSKGIPVIFQDELDEKPEIGNKSPIILKDEKPPLLPPSYNSTNIDGDNDCDEYVPPPAVVIGGREIRGKSPVTPSYRKPPPYVSP